VIGLVLQQARPSLIIPSSERKPIRPLPSRQEESPSSWSFSPRPTASAPTRWPTGGRSPPASISSAW